MKVSRRSLQTGVLLFLVALLLRLWGLGFGLPYFFSGDEVEKTEVALYLADTHFDHWDGQPSFLFNSLFAIYAFAGRVAPHLTNVDYVYLGRLWMAILGSLTVVAVWRLGAKFEESGERGGLFAALFLAVLPLHTACSRYIKEDAPLALMTTLTALAAVAYLRAPSRRGLALLGLAVGMAVSTKYTGLLLLVPVGAVVAVRAWNDRPGRRALAVDLGILAATAAGGFLLLSPMFLLHPERLLEGLRYQGEYSVSGHDGIVISPWKEWWTYYLRTGLLPGMTWPAVVLAAVGLVLLLRKHCGWVVSLAALWLYIVLEYLPAKPAPFAARYLMPLVPLLAVAAGVALARLAGALRTTLPAGVAYAFCAVGFIGPPLVKSIRIAEEARHDTRTIAGRWMDQHIPAGARIVLTEKPLNLPATDSWYARWQVDDRGKQPGLATEWGGGPAPYFVISSFTSDRFLENPDAVPERTRFYRTVLNDFPVVQRFVPRWLTYGKHSPVITIARPGGAGGAGTDSSGARAPVPSLLFGAVEAPAAGTRVSDSVALRGWALGQGGIAEVRVFIDGRFWRRLPINTARPDITRSYWSLSRGWDRHGWELFATLPGETRPGEHLLAFRALDRAGNAREIGVARILVAWER